MTIKSVQNMLGRDYIGPAELSAIAGKLGIAVPEPACVLPVPFSEEELRHARRDGYLLILGVPAAADGEPLTLNKLHTHFGADPALSEPCFYNQDWYLHEPFACEAVLEPRWYLMRKTVEKQSRGKEPDAIAKAFPKRKYLPSAILTAYAFFAYYLHTGGEMLWEHDFVWCSDRDGNGDRIYTGRYRDPLGSAKNGFNIHRHLTIRNAYGAAPMRT